MALVVEDGTGVAGANTYHSLVTATAYFAERPNTAWTAATDAQRTAALLFSTQWLEERYGPYLDGAILDSEQSLLWPRSTFYDSTGRIVETGTVPERWKNAQLEAAAAHLTSGLNEVRSRGGAIESVRAGSVGVTFADSAPLGRTFPFIDSLVSTLLVYWGTRRLVRA